MEEVYPEVVITDPSTNLKSVAYDHLIAPLIEAIKTLYDRVVGLEAQQNNQARQISKLKEENAELRARLEKIEKALNSK